MKYFRSIIISIPITNLGRKHLKKTYTLVNSIVNVSPVYCFMSFHHIINKSIVPGVETVLVDIFYTYCNKCATLYSCRKSGRYSTLYSFCPSTWSISTIYMKWMLGWARCNWKPVLLWNASRQSGHCLELLFYFVSVGTFSYPLFS